MTRGKLSSGERVACACAKDRAHEEERTCCWHFETYSDRKFSVDPQSAIAIHSFSVRPRAPRLDAPVKAGVRHGRENSEVGAPCKNVTDVLRQFCSVLVPLMLDRW